MLDEEILQLIKENDDGAMEFMVKKYGVIVRRETRSLYLAGAETEDLLQEGMIGLFKAIRDFDPDKGALFSTFATLCVRRQIQAAIRNFNRKKHIPLNSYISLYAENEENGTILLDDIVLETTNSNPEEKYLADERVAQIQRCFQDSLSDLEKTVLKLYLQGMSYQEIAIEIDKSEKSVDNAIQRIRQKMRENDN